MRIGFIGLGSMGAGMARNIARAGFALTVNDLRRESAEALLAEGAAWAATPAEVAAASDVVITSLPAPRHVEQVALGADGLVAGLAPGCYWVDMSTSVPSVADKVRDAVAGRGAHIVDAPVSGMSAGARDATLQIFVGATAEQFAALLPVLRSMGDPDRILHVGPAGAGYAVKLMINLLWFSQLVATAEVLAIGARAGVDLGVLRSSLLASPANSTFLERDVMSVLEHGDYDEGFAIALACKDLGLAVDLARDLNVPAELSALVEQIYRRARAAYGDAAGEMSPVRLYEDIIGGALRTAATVVEEILPDQRGGDGLAYEQTPQLAAQVVAQVVAEQTAETERHEDRAQ
ncbi:3-hydroxyisobutyrate dehydrogenase [Murinocardiopsis flavida]|uniref:3-hydroxyisobutyrate dehydrogenase n=1 Tax=Murinocardiopsis flavida TaxID=645275 RepID=A0A2P8CZ14_9ACTN|nr:NAD(P)-dependent oxidoreductase [Murinocardiopsis flavida]PSK90204.1 3-hydroxyisobutyrate dehydrogenase [Murinocardiopsis flavida]